MGKDFVMCRKGEIKMDRVIKFRGKRIDNGEWVYGYYFKDKEGNSLIKIIEESFTNSECNEKILLELDYEVVPETVGQYTGLEDKNGKEVYEGDVIEFQYRRLDGTYITVKSEVQYGAGQFGIMIDEVGTLTDYMSLCDLIGEVGQEFQVTGNKFIYA